MKVTSREKTVLIIGAVAAAAILIFYAATKFLPDSGDLSQTVEIKKRMLRSQRDTLSRDKLYKNRLEEFKKQLDHDMTRFLPGDNANLAGAELQRIIREFADQSDVDITQRNILAEKKVQDIVTKVSIRVDTKCTPEQLVHFLAAIQNYEKLLNIDELAIISPRIYAGRARQEKFEISPSLTISGFIRTQPDKPNAGSGAGASSARS